jgi:hypothetical protein
MEERAAPARVKEAQNRLIWTLFFLVLKGEIDLVKGIDVERGIREGAEQGFILGIGVCSIGRSVHG